MCERTVSRARTLAFIALSIAVGSPASNLRLHLGTLALRGNAYPMMPKGRPGSGSKTSNQAFCSGAPRYGLLQRWHTSCR